MSDVIALLRRRCRRHDFVMYDDSLKKKREPADDRSIYLYQKQKKERSDEVEGSFGNVQRVACEVGLGKYRHAFRADLGSAGRKYGRRNILLASESVQR
jgi:hypothetical protein